MQHLLVLTALLVLSKSRPIDGQNWTIADLIPKGYNNLVPDSTNEQVPVAVGIHVLSLLEVNEAEQVRRLC